MTAKELADKMNGRLPGCEITQAETEQAERSNLVVVYGASDDLIEVEGAFQEELGGWGGRTLFLHPEYGFVHEPEDEDWETLTVYGVSEVVSERLSSSRTIKAVWGGEEGTSWTFKTDIPHETFDVIEDGEVFCRGIVFSLDDLKRLE